VCVHWTRRIILLVCVKHDVALTYIYDALIIVISV